MKIFSETHCAHHLRITFIGSAYCTKRLCYVWCDSFNHSSSSTTSSEAVQTMAFLGNGQGKGLSNAKGNVKCKEIALEVYDDATFLINNKPIERGALALFMALRSAEEDRRNVDSDNTLKFLRGLIANDASQRPPYAEDLLQALPRGCVLQYARPGANDNMSAWAVVVNDTFAYCPGVWCLQIGAPSPSLLGQGINTFMSHAILNKGGWTQISHTKILQRTATPANRAPWTEHAKICLKPRGFVSEKAASMLDEIVVNYDFILHDGALAFTEKKDTKIKYGCGSKEAAIAAVSRRDLRVYENTLSPGPTSDVDTSSTNLSPRQMEIEINDSHFGDAANRTNIWRRQRK